MSKDETASELDKLNKLMSDCGDIGSIKTVFQTACDNLSLIPNGEVISKNRVEINLENIVFRQSKPEKVDISLEHVPKSDITDEFYVITALVTYNSGKESRIAVHPQRFFYDRDKAQTAVQEVVTYIKKKDFCLEYHNDRAILHVPYNAPAFTIDMVLNSLSTHISFIENSVRPKDRQNVRKAARYTSQAVNMARNGGDWHGPLQTAYDILSDIKGYKIVNGNQINIPAANLHLIRENMEAILKRT